MAFPYTYSRSSATHVCSLVKVLVSAIPQIQVSIAKCVISTRYKHHYWLSTLWVQIASAKNCKATYSCFWKATYSLKMRESDLTCVCFSSLCEFDWDIKIRPTISIIKRPKEQGKAKMDYHIHIHLYTVLKHTVISLFPGSGALKRLNGVLIPVLQCDIERMKLCYASEAT